MVMNGDGLGPPDGRFSRLVAPHRDGSRGSQAQGVKRKRALQSRSYPDNLPPWEAVKIIGDLGRETKWQDALALFWPLHRKMAYNTRVWNAMISACAGKGRSWEAALGLLERLEVDPHLDADVVSCLP